MKLPIDRQEPRFIEWIHFVMENITRLNRNRIERQSFWVNTNFRNSRRPCPFCYNYYSSTNEAAITNALIAQTKGFGRKIMIVERIFAIEKVGLGNGKCSFI